MKRLLNAAKQHPNALPNHFHPAKAEIFPFQSGGRGVH